MLTLKKKGKKLILSKESLRKVYGGEPCGQGCLDSCPDGNNCAKATYYMDHHEALIGNFALEK